MVFNSVVFLFCFLPLSLLLYYLVPGRAKNAVLLAESLLFYCWTGVAFLPLIAVLIVFNYLWGLLTARARTTLRGLLPLAAVLTPNIPEAEILSGLPITDAAGMEAAARTISQRYGCAVLCKGGHQINDADDLLWRDGGGKWFRGRRIANPNTHGTGCTLSSAIASNLAKGYDLDESVERAKAYISGALAAMLDLGRGSGPMNHMFDLKGGFAE